MDASDIDDALFQLTAEDVQELDFDNDDDDVEDKKPPKRKRGRPRKRPITPPHKPDDLQEQEAPPAAPAPLAPRPLTRKDLREQERELKGQSLLREDYARALEETKEVLASPDVSDEVKGLLYECRKRIGIIEDLRKKLRAYGTGKSFKLGMTLHDPKKLGKMVIDMDSEIALINSEINCRRADGVAKAMLVGAMPYIEMAIKSAVSPEDFDPTGLQKEVENNFELFEEACTQLAIMHRDWVAVGPLPEIMRNVGLCANSCDYKNKKERERIAANKGN